MRTVVVERTLKASIEHVFDSIADPARFEQLAGAVRRVELVREGHPDSFGLGALRRVDLGPVWLQEEVTAFERPTRWDYLIHQSRPRFTHHGGSIRLQLTTGGTQVSWTSTFSIPVPLVGGAAARLAQLVTARSFNVALATS